MITKLRALLLPFLFVCSIAHAGDPEGSAAAANPNHFFFHPVITIASLVAKGSPLVLAMTYERNLAVSGNSFIWKPELILGDGRDSDVTFSAFGTFQYLGLRHYFGRMYRGFYLQGSGTFTVAAVGAKQDGNPDKASGTITEFGALAYLGYRWSHVYWDVGAGYQGGNGDMRLDDGQEVSIRNSGPTYDASLGFGF